MIQPEIKRKIEKVVNVFETGTPEGRYDLLVVMNDGPGGRPQITYGRSQTTEFGNLRKLVKMYCDRAGQYAQALLSWLDIIGKEPLSDNTQFKKLLRDAARNDPVMRLVQDVFFEEVYFAPAQTFFESNGFTLPLALLVIYDSYIHSGRVPDFLRRRFGEKVPSAGGNEKEWVTRYVDVRHQWLKYHSNEILRRTIYRTQCFKDQIAADNWMLSQPVRANGVEVI
ncbi:MAG: peptidoglycan-binding protein [Bacteroidales bacterium]|jgi:chitosanase|nr:chitosanase [Bacteroidales bacterium]NPV35057.1 peptidoglycan-binding protein [Bacteroidales bacterium]